MANTRHRGSSLSRALGCALLAEPMLARAARPALVVRCSGRTPTRDTVPIVYDEGDDAAWYAELRAKQAVR